MANFKIGDRVKVIGLVDEDKTGIIVAKGDMPTVELGKVVPGKELKPEMQITWWKVKVDGISEEKNYPDDRLEKLE